MELFQSSLIMIILLELKIIRLENSQELAPLRIRCWIIWDTVVKIRDVSLICKWSDTVKLYCPTYALGSQLRCRKILPAAQLRQTK